MKPLRTNIARLKQQVLTSLLGKAESLNINCTAKVFNDPGQLLVHFFDFLPVGWPTCRSMISPRRVDKTTAYHV